MAAGRPRLSRGNPARRTRRGAGRGIRHLFRLLLPLARRRAGRRTLASRCPTIRPWSAPCRRAISTMRGRTLTLSAEETVPDGMRIHRLQMATGRPRVAATRDASSRDAAARSKTSDEHERACAATCYDKHEAALRARRRGLPRAQLFHAVSRNTGPASRRRRSGRGRARGLSRRSSAGHSNSTSPARSAGSRGEVSPYTLEPLGIDYPRADLDALFAAARDAMVAWATASPRARLGVCMEIVDRLYERIFESAQAVMHTAGQSGPMSYAGSGTNALDRGVEALAYAHDGDDRRAGGGAVGAPLRLERRSACASVIGSCRAASPCASPARRSRPGTRIRPCSRASRPAMP